MVERAMALASATPSRLEWTCGLVSSQKFMILAQVGLWRALFIYVFV